MPYTRLLDVYAAVAGLSRPQVGVPGLPSAGAGRAGVGRAAYG